jgi:hypothetical protein
LHVHLNDVPATVHTPWTHGFDEHGFARSGKGKTNNHCNTDLNRFWIKKNNTEKYHNKRKCTQNLHLHLCIPAYYARLLNLVIIIIMLGY